ncbi:MAG: ATP-binding protein [Nanoarchaeota archaeon]|nr:ATP-binding protein [Nanoarchaeota archaeon]
MSQLFINREKEIEFLKERHNSKKPEFIVLYGRRRVGKTALAVKFLDGAKGIYFLSSKEGDRENIGSFSRESASFLSDPAFADAEYKDWFSVFSALTSHIKFSEIEKKEKIAVVIDEFPYLIYSNSAIPSIFQRIWELLLKEKNIMLILLGSSVSVMESDVLGEKSPLYGRRTGDWNVAPMQFPALSKFLPGCGMEELINTWFVIGGMPEYLLQFDPNLGFFGNVEKNMLKKGCYLYNEAEFLMSEEFREPKNYKLILRAISFGKNTAGEICGNTGLDKGMVSKYLDVLKGLRLIFEELPVTASRQSKNRRYSIADPYFNFWFRYIYPNKSELEAFRTPEVLGAVKKDFGNYSGRLFEQFIMDSVRDKTLLPEISFSRISRWWHKGNEIDIVAVDDEKKEILFVECKWKENVDGEDILYGLKTKSALVEWHNNERKEHFAVFAKSFKKKAAGCYDLKDISRMLAKAQ